MEKNEVVGLVGPNGAGKTTLLHLLTGYYRPSDGVVLYKNKDITKLSPEKRILLGMSRTFQLVSTFHNLKVIDNLILVHFRKVNKKFPFLKAFLHKMDFMNEHEQINNYLEMFEFSDMAEEIVGNLSMGQKRRLEIAMALISEPEVLFLDEPFSGLGDAEIAKLLEVLKRVISKKTVIIVEHKISKIKDIVERVIVMNEGKIIADGDFEKVFQSPEVREAYWGIK